MKHCERRPAGSSPELAKSVNSFCCCLCGLRVGCGCRAGACFRFLAVLLWVLWPGLGLAAGVCFVARGLLVVCVCVCVCVLCFVRAHVVKYEVDRIRQVKGTSSL